MVSNELEYVCVINKINRLRWPNVNTEVFVSRSDTHVIIPVKMQFWPFSQSQTSEASQWGSGEAVARPCHSYMCVSQSVAVVTVTD